MKVVRSLRHEPHPSIIQFEAFCITPNYAMQVFHSVESLWPMLTLRIIMPYLSHLIQVCLPPKKATPYFRQLASAVGYLHERGITHNDIKPANIMISHNDIPILVDFGFAHAWPANGRGAFLSTITWGTPEVS
jgi:protein-serine/threonine kinase